MKFETITQSKKIQIGCFITVALGLIFYLAQSEVLDADDPSHGLFPLTVGKTWIYQVATEMDDPAIEKTLTLSVDRKIDFEDMTTWVRVVLMALNTTFAGMTQASTGWRTGQIWKSMQPKTQVAATYLKRLFELETHGMGA